MELFHLFSILIVLSAAFAFINFRVLKLPSSIGLMIVSLAFSIVIIITGKFIPAIQHLVINQVKSIDFSELLLEVMLSFMLFAGAIHIKFKDLKDARLSILLFSTVSVLISTFIIGFSAYYILMVFGIKVQLIYAMLFGALISPTDPIAVISILKNAGISKSLETKMAGESLFNDGVAVVVFLTLLELTSSNVDFDFMSIFTLFGQEAIGGLILGFIIGWSGYKMIASIDNYHVEVLITLAIVMGGYTLAHFIHVSGPLAMVISGLIIGNHGKDKGMSEVTAEYIDKFWELIDEILNAILFVLIGLEILVIHSQSIIVLIAVILIVIGLSARFISVLIPSLIIRFKEKIGRKTLYILTWGGLRGGISIALALSIPSQFNKEIWVTITFVIVCFSILVQGLTIGKFAKALQNKNKKAVL
jgi:CPA1 family monovalent cation:H+ antiporter